MESIRHIYLDMQNLWLQDGATHIARETMGILRGIFLGRLVSSFGDVPWPPLSLD